MKELKFFKMQGAGNDYVFVDGRMENVEYPSRLAEIVSKRRFSIGSDGLVVILNSDTCDCKMQIYNADGSLGKTCGTAIRCVGKYVGEGLKRTELTVQTDSGVASVKICGDTVYCGMGRAEFRADNLPPVGLFVMPYGGKEFVFTAVSVGNPHAVAIVPDFNFDLLAVASELQNSGVFPEGVNVEFAVVAEGSATVRVVERGSGETFSCGSGACAVGAVLKRYGVAEGRVRLKFLGGVLTVDVEDDYSLTLGGDANFVYSGVIDYE